MFECGEYLLVVNIYVSPLRNVFISVTIVRLMALSPLPYCFVVVLSVRVNLVELMELKFMVHELQPVHFLCCLLLYYLFDIFSVMLYLKFIMSVWHGHQLVFNAPLNTSKYKYTVFSFCNIIMEKMNKKENIFYTATEGELNW